MVLYMSVEHMDRKYTGTNGILMIFCKNLTSFKLKIPGLEEANNVAASIDSAVSYYPFYMNRLNFDILHNGWELFDYRA